MKNIKRMVSVFLTIVILIPAFVHVTSFESNAGGTFVITGKNTVTIPLAEYPEGSAHYNCWEFAQLVYGRIWGTSFTSYRGTSDDMLRNVGTGNARAITASNTRNFISAAPLGSVIRVADYIDEHDSMGTFIHSQILVQKDSSGFTVYHSNYSKNYGAPPAVWLSYYTWDSYARIYASYKYFKYIKYPGATPYGESTWSPASITTGNYYLKNKSTGTYLTVSGYADTNERNVVVESLNSNTTNRKAQAMAVSKVSSAYKLRPQICSSRLINANAWQIVSGTNVNIFDDVADSTQYWHFEAASGGGYIIRNAQNTSCVLNAESSGNVNVATYSGGNSQIWYLESADHTHSYSSSVTKSATCTESGTKKYTCSCGSSYTETIAALGHSYTNYTYNNNATCTADGTKTAYCNNGCGTSNTIAETGTQTAHQYSSRVIKPASCTETGIKEYTCTSCSSSYTETISMDMHWWSEWRVVKQPSYNEYGIKVCSCLNCGTEKTENINKLEHPFVDVKEGKWYTDAVVWCFKNGYMAGVSGTVFGYKENVTRGMFATILAKIDGAAIIMNAYPTMSFSDVISGKWYSDSIEWAYRNGYAAGIGNNKFGYKDPVTREQIALFFYTYSSKKGYNVANKADLSVFSDFQSVHVWALDAVEWAVANGVISGTGANELSPRNSATRAEIAVIVKKYVETIVK